MAVILAEQKIEGFEYNSSVGVFVKVITPSPCVLEVDKEYTVKWGDEEHACTSFLANINGFEMIAVGNTMLAGGVDTGQKFAIAYNPTTDFLNLFALEADASHDVAIYSVEETPDEPIEPVGVAIILYDKTGEPITHEGIETLTTDTPDAEKGATFTYGVAVENAEYAPDFAEGDQKVTLEKGQLLKEFTITKPENLLPEHIKKNIEVAGVIGKFAGDEKEKTVDLNFGCSISVSDEEAMEAFLTGENNVGKYVKYVGNDGKYSKGTYYKVCNTYNEFEAEKCASSATEVKSDTTLTSSVECRIGDLIIAAFAVRSRIVSVGDGWTLISTSNDAKEINPTATVSQTLSFAYKYATETTEEFTVTQETAGRIYLNMVAFSNAIGFEDNGYQYMSTETLEDSTQATFVRPTSEIVLWGITRTLYDATAPYQLWKSSNDSVLIQLGEHSQSRLLMGIDSGDEEQVTFSTAESASTKDAYICGCLSIQMKPIGYEIAEVKEMQIFEQQVIEAEKDTVLTKVMVNKPETLVPENVKAGVDIGGVIGTFGELEEETDGAYTVCVIDYDGTIIKESKLNTGDVFKLPTPPNHERLIFDGWFTSATITEGTITVGEADVIVEASYDVASCAIEIDILLTQRVGTVFGFNSLPTGTTLIDWGDGTADTSTTHTYAELGVYTIKIYNATTFEGSSSSSSIIKSGYAACVLGIFVPNGVTIGSYAFTQLTSLRYVLIPKNTTKLGDYCFDNCKALRHVTIPESVSTIGYYTFRYCYSLRYVVFKGNVVSIGKHAFAYCYDVEFYDFTQFSVPPTMSTTDAFEGIQCTTLIKVKADLYSNFTSAYGWSTFKSYIVGV